MELQKYVERKEIDNKFLAVLGAEKKQTFVNNMLSIVQSNNYLSKCSSESIVGAALMSANIGLPINNTLGYAYIVPYRSNAQFQIGYKGLKQLALRTGNYKILNVEEVYDGELKSFDRFKEVYDFSGQRKENAQIIGFMAYMKLKNGFEKTIYWTVKKCTDHGKKFSKTFHNDKSPWQTNFDAMARKTVLKHILSNWGDLTIESPLNQAIEADQGILDSDLNATFEDNPLNDRKIVVTDEDKFKKERLQKWALFQTEFKRKCENCKDVSELKTIQNAAIFKDKQVGENSNIKNILNLAYKKLTQKDAVQDAEIVTPEKDF